MLSFEVFLENEPPDNIYDLPCRRLLRAILANALQDLETGNKVRYNRARRWLLEWRDGMPNYISFKDVCDYLEVEESERRYLLKRHLCSR